MKDSLFFFPQRPKTGEYSNPYSQNYKNCLEQYFNVIDKDKRQKGLRAIGLLKYSTKADVYVFNWIESIPHLRFGFIQFLCAMVALRIIKIRHASIVWMFHNIRPHQGENWMTRYISNWLFQNSTLIVSHSKEAAEYANERAKCKVEYRCHPTESIPVNDWSDQIAPFDVFIWGAILPYKGIAEFISLPEVQSSSLRIKIIGSCKDKNLDQQILSCTNEHIVYENRRADFAEIAANCKSAKFVLFPYIGDCVSSSGALIDTIVFGGTPVGPSLGAFKDLAEEGVCVTYADYDNLINLLVASKKIHMSDTVSFLKNNSWDKMGEFIYNRISLYRSKSKSI